MKRILLLLLLIAAPLFAQQQIPSLERGFNPEKLYQFNGLDNVSLFNGNLTILLPIGLEYPLDGGLTYQLRLSYNSRIWEFARSGSGTVGYPVRRANAGAGWILGYGAFLPAVNANNNAFADVYQSPDGADHRFDSPQNTDLVKYTSDGSRLRLRTITSPPSVAWIDFPDGTTQYYAKQSDDSWLLSEITAARGTAKVTFTNLSQRPSACTSGTDAWQKVSDGVRSHYLCFETWPMDDVQKLMIESVIFEGPQNQTSIYRFTYETIHGVADPVGAVIPDPVPPGWRYLHDVTLLKSVTLPDSTTYDFEHDSYARMRAMVLPTKGRVEYDYGELYDVPPPALCANGYDTKAPWPQLLGTALTVISKRTLRNLVPPGKAPDVNIWTYSWTKRFNPPGALCYAPLGTDEVDDPLPDELIATVIDPTGGRVDSHFSVWPGDMATDSDAGFKGRYNGFPYGSYDAAQNRWLSQEQFQCAPEGVEPCTKLRSTYVRHDLEARPPLPQFPNAEMPIHRLASERIVQHDNPVGCTISGPISCKSTITESTDWDGFGHYRTITTSHDEDVPGSRAVTTEWNKVNGAPRTFDATDKWTVDEYEQVTSQEGASKTIEQVCYAPIPTATEQRYLKARRKLKGATPGANDLITLYDVNSEGNLTKEQHYGGDAIPLASDVATATNLCSAVSNSLGPPSFELNHTWQFGVLAKTQYAGTAFRSLDLTIDKSGLVTESRDRSGVLTTAGYDSSGRITTITPRDSAATSYTYQAAVASNGYLTSAAKATQTTGTGTLATETHYLFDSLGRVWRQKMRLPGDGWSLNEILYDSLNRKKSVSEQEALTDGEMSFTPSSVTTTTYDLFNRPLETIAPDNRRVRIAYLGTQQQSIYITDPGQSEHLRFTQQYDGFGQLTGVIEADATGVPSTTYSSIDTTYRYDVAGHLTSVSMQAKAAAANYGPAQSRSFVYDGRGFLISETHPESGTTTYTYDARGHIKTRTDATGTVLNYAYDAAERLTSIEQDDVGVLKTMTYDTTADVSYPGKLVQAVRHNRLPGTNTDVQVRETYSYEGRDGRLSSTKTEVFDGQTLSRTFVTGQQYDDLGNIASLAYPSCSDCMGLTQPERTIINGYAHGFLTTIGTGVSANAYASIDYHPNGLVASIQHKNADGQNGPLYTQTLANGMARPRSIKVTTDRPACSAPATTITTASSITVGTSATASVPFTTGTTYAWTISNGTITAGANTDTVTFTTSCNGPMELTVTATASCGTRATAVRTITVTAPMWPADQFINSGTSTTFSVNVPSGATIAWYRGISGDTSVPAGTGASMNTGLLAQTTRYWCSVTLASGCTLNSPTLKAEVCRLTEILYPEEDATTAENVTKGATVRAEVVATATGISYSWERVPLTYNVDTQTWTEGSPVPLPDDGDSVEWNTNSIGTTDEYWGFRVTVGGSCPGSSSVTRMVAIFRVIATPECQPPAFGRHLPPERRVWWTDHRVTLAVSLANGALPDDHQFEWYVDGALRAQGVGRTDFSIALTDLKPRLVTVRIYRNCANGKKSDAVSESTYLYTDDNCPAPPLVVDRTSVTLNEGRFYANSIWPSVDFQWYRGDSGNTRSPISVINGGTRDWYEPTEPGTYWVRAISRCGTTSDSATLLAVSNSCPMPVQFIRQPVANTDTAAANPVTLSFSTDPDALTRIQWRENGVDLPGQTGRMLTIWPTQTTTYDVVATGCNSSTSDNAVVHVVSCESISIQQQPTGAAIDLGQSAPLSVSATSAYPLSYQWYIGNSGDTSNKINGATLPSLSVNPNETTRYWVRITAPGVCAADSADVEVSVCRSPEFAPSETFEMVSPIPDWQFWLEANVIGDNLSYTWYDGMVDDLTTVLSTDKSLILRPSATKSFWLAVKSDCPARTSATDPVTKRQYRISVCPEITVQPYLSQPKVVAGTEVVVTLEAPRADRIEWYAGTTLIPNQNGPVLRYTVNAATTFYAHVYSGSCWVPSDPVTVQLCDQPTVQWNSASVRTKPGQTQTLSLQSTTSGSDINYTFFIGATAGDVAGSTLYSTGPNGYLGISPTQTTTYWARAAEVNGCYADTTPLTIDVCIPTITAQPQGITITQGGTAHLTVTTDLDNTPKLHYQWYRGSAGDSSQPVATTPALDVNPTDDTSYWVRITSTCTTGPDAVVDSSAALVTVCKPPQITEQPTPAHAYANIAVSLRVVATGTNLSYQWYRGATGVVSDPVNGATSNSLSIAVTQTTDFWVRVTGSCGSIDSNAARVSISPSITTHPAGGAVTKGITRTLTVVATGTYLTYEWYTGTGGSAVKISGATSSSYTTPPINTDVTYWVRVSSGSWSVDSNTAVFTVCQPRGISVTYSTRISGSSVMLQVDGSAPDETFEWYEGAQGNTTTLVAQTLSFTTYPTQTTSYWVRTKRPSCNADSAATSVVVCIPKITGQPANGSVLTGSSATLSVAATGTGPLSYQWYLGSSGDTSQPIAGATSASYTTPSLTSSKTYWVRVSSPVQSGCSTRSADSQAATITTCNTPAISSLTGSQRSISGSAVTLSVTATGGSLAYEWHQGTVGSGPVIGTTSSISVAPTASTTYWVRVYNGCGSINSTAVDVSVYPVITAQPQNTSACAGATARFTVSATGANLSYVWYVQYSGQSAQVIGGNNSYADVPATAAAVVSVNVTSGTATTVSANATLSQLPAPLPFTLTKAVYSATQWTLTATVNSADEFLVQYEWYRGSLGDTSNRITAPINSYVIVVTPPSRPMTYWVRVKYIDTGCYTDKAITIQ